MALAFRYPAKICGTLCLGAGWPSGTSLQPSTDRLITYIIIGTQDSNYSYDIPSTQGALVADGIRCVVQTWGGGHVWSPADMVMNACRWLHDNAEIDPNVGLPPVGCPEATMVCQIPAGPVSPWQSYLSDSGSGQSLFENFEGLTKPIMRVDWWAISGTYNETADYWIPSDPGAAVFTVGIYTDDGGVPGTVVHQETATVTRENLPQLYLRNYPLRHYSLEFASPVLLSSGWVQIKQIRESTAPAVFWLNSTTGDGHSLKWSEADGVYSSVADNLAVALVMAELKVDFAAYPAWGRPPLNVSFSGRATGNIGPIGEWRWDFGDGTILEGDFPDPSHLYVAEGDYTVSLSASTAGDTATTTKSGLIGVNHALSLSKLVPVALCLSLILAFSIRRIGTDKTQAD